MPLVETSARPWHVDDVFVCSGNDLETLYPSVFVENRVTRCKLHMMRTVAQPRGRRLGPPLCSGLTLLHCPAFRGCQSLEALRRHLSERLPFHVDARINVLVSSTGDGELTIGDSHEYGLTHEPFACEEIYDAVLQYANSFMSIPYPRIAQRWLGYYPVAEDATDLLVQPEPNVTVVNCVGGAGMTFSLGLAEENTDLL